MTKRLLRTKLSICLVFAQIAINNPSALAQKFGFNDKQDTQAGAYAPPEAKDVGPKKVKKVCGSKPCTFETDFGGREMTMQPAGFKAGGQEVNVEAEIQRAPQRKGTTRVRR